MTQRERIYNFMKDFGSITAYDAFFDLGVSRLSARIKEMSDSGIMIGRKTETSKNRYGEKVSYTRYFLKE